MIRWPDLEALALRLGVGEHAIFARSAGRWSVILMADETWTKGVTVSHDHRERGRALLEALDWSISEGPMSKLAETGKKIARAILGTIAVVSTTKRCPKCGARKVVRVAFGATVLGHSCRACKWERAEG